MVLTLALGPASQEGLGFGNEFSQHGKVGPPAVFTLFYCLRNPYTAWRWLCLKPQTSLRLATRQTYTASLKPKTYTLKRLFVALLSVCWLGEAESHFLSSSEAMLSFIELRKPSQNKQSKAIKSELLQPPSLDCRWPHHTRALKSVSTPP